MDRFKRARFDTLETKISTAVHLQGASKTRKAKWNQKVSLKEDKEAKCQLQLVELLESGKKKLNCVSMISIFNG